MHMRSFNWGVYLSSFVAVVALLALAWEMRPVRSKTCQLCEELMQRSLRGDRRNAPVDDPLSVTELDEFICTSGNFKGTTPLIIAAQGVDVVAVKAMLAHGVPVNFVDAKGRSALKALMPEWRDGDVRARECADMLLSAGADVNLGDALSGIRPVHAAANFGRNDAVQWLATHGADFSVPNNIGMTPFRLAEKAGHHKTALTVQELVNQR